MSACHRVISPRYHRWSFLDILMTFLGFGYVILFLNDRLDVCSDSGAPWLSQRIVFAVKYRIVMQKLYVSVQSHAIADHFCPLIEPDMMEAPFFCFL